MPYLRRRILERLMRYYRYLSDLTARKQVDTVISAQIAEAVGIDATQVRKDFSTIGLQGMGRVGFEVCEICRAIRVALGFDQRYEAVLIGIGHLGSALISYPGFAKYGLHIVAAFDNDHRKTGGKIAGCTLRSTMLMKSFIQKHGIRIAILTTPANVSQELTDRLVSAGVDVIWNFTPTRLEVPEGILVRDEHISMGLAQIAHHLKQ